MDYRRLRFPGLLTESIEEIQRSLFRQRTIFHSKIGKVLCIFFKPLILPVSEQRDCLEVLSLQINTLLLRKEIEKAQLT